MDRGARGSTLVELLVGSAIALLALMAVANMEMSAWKYQKVDEARFAIRAESAATMDRLLAEVRQASRAAVPEPSVLTLELPGGTVTYRWNKATGELLREDRAGQRQAGRQVADARFVLEAGGRTLLVDLKAVTTDGAEYRLTSRATLRIGAE